jgi:eukaryotic-like serine/threonine-protein kinase
VDGVFARQRDDLHDLLNVVSVRDILDINGSPGLIMEYVDGPSLEDLLQRYQPSMADAELIAEGIIQGVAAAHELGLIHRDLKPANILLKLSGGVIVPKVADFGLVKLLCADESAGKGRTRTGIAMGTPSYMAPEQVRDAKTADRRADIFSLGAILFELFCHQRAFDGEDLADILTAVKLGEYPAPRTLVPNLPTRIVKAIEHSLEVDRRKRIGSCPALLATLRGESEKPTGGKATGWSPGLIEHASSLGSEGKPAPLVKD